MCGGGNTVRNTPSIPHSFRPEEAALHSAGRDSVAPDETPQAPPRLSLFRLAFKSALERLPFVKSSHNDITTNLDPGSAAHRAASLLQNFSKPNVSADRLSNALLVALPKDPDPDLGAKPKFFIRTELERHVDKLSDQQLYRLGKRANSRRMQGVIAGLSRQADAETDPYKKKVLRKTAQCLRDTASVATQALQKRGYRTPALASTPASASKELRVFTKNIDRFITKMSSDYTLTGSPELKEQENENYAELNGIAETATLREARTGLPEGVKPAWYAGKDYNKLPETLDNGITWPGLAVKDCGRGMADSSYVKNADGGIQRILPQDELEGLANYTLAGNEELIARFHAGLKKQFGDDPRLLYKIAWTLSQDTSGSVSRISTPGYRNESAGHVLPHYFRSLNPDAQALPRAYPTNTKFTLSQDSANVYVDFEQDVPGADWYTAGNDFGGLMDADTSLLKGHSRIVIPKNHEQPPRLDSVRVEGTLHVALTD